MLHSLSMKFRIAVIIVLLLGASRAIAQSLSAFAEDIRKTHHIPELAIAVVSADSVIEVDYLGTKKVNADLAAAATDRFRIGSNTKTITGLIAAMLVKQGKISWDTKFFDLYPEMKAKSNPAYYNITLLNLLSFRTKLPRYTYTDAKPVKSQFSGTEDQQRYQFTQWAFAQKPIATTGETSFSNLGYVAAGLMLEKVSHKTYKQLVNWLGMQVGADFRFGNPNATDSLQPWGHNSDLVPEPAGDNYKLEWLLAAGNINASLPDYIKYIQYQLKGLAGRSNVLTKEEFQFLHYGLPVFAVGWFWETDEQGHKYSHHTGNPGTFLSQVHIFSDSDRGYILFANVQSPEAEEGLGLIYEEMKKRFEK